MFNSSRPRLTVAKRRRCTLSSAGMEIMTTFLFFDDPDGVHYRVNKANNDARTFELLEKCGVNEGDVVPVTELRLEIVDGRKVHHHYVTVSRPLPSLLSKKSSSKKRN